MTGVPEGFPGGVPEGLEVWRGAAAPWECGQADRLDIRFLLAKAMEGLAGLAAELGMDDAFAPAARSTLIVREHRLRCLKPIPAGAALVMTAGVASIGEDDAVFVQVLRDRAGEPCAAVLARVVHVAAREARPFAWSARTRAAAEALALSPPSFARSRGLAGVPAATAASRARADELGLAATGRGVVQAGECDLFGRMRPEAVLGRCMDGVVHLFGGDAEPDGGGRPDRAPLQARILYPRPAVPGARLELRSGVAAVGARAVKAVHWLLAGDGEPYAAAMILSAAVAGDRAALAALRPEGLTP